jgi:PIN domain nuclease of toxin-antitoxin system
MAFLELQYLYRRNRVRAEASEIYSHLHALIGLNLCTLPFPAVAMEALHCDWTTDPFDRIIVSQAKANRDAGLITSDLEIRKNYSSAIW